MTEKHVIKIIVDIRRVKLLVRFPCKLTFQLKTDSSQVETRTAYELKKGQCIVNQIITTETEVWFDSLSGQYEDKQIRLVIQMTSNNGVIPAGSVSFNPCNKQYEEKVQYTLPLEKCPDRTAQIIFLQSYQLVHKNQNGTIYQSQGPKSAKPEIKNSSSANIFKSQVQRKSPHRGVSKQSRNMRISPKNNNASNNRRSISPIQNQQRVKTSSQAYTYQQPRRSQYSGQYDNYQKFGESNVEDEQEQILQQPQYFIARERQNNFQSYEKSQYIREIAKLKGQLKILQSQDRRDQIFKVKQQNETLMGELQKMRERLRAMERKERQYNIQLKDARQEAERNKNKHLQSQAVKNQCEVVMSDKEKTIKQLQTEAKKLNEKFQDLTIQLNNQQKRVQFKQNSFQQQLKKINQKYSQSESERQKLTFDYNSLLMKLEESQKKNQTTVKEKERTYVEQKNKLNKRIEQFIQIQNKLKEQLSDKQSQLLQSNNQLNAMNQREIDRELKLTNVQSDLQQTKGQLKKQKDQKQQLEKQKQYFKAIQQERNVLRKRNNQMTVDLSKINEKSQRQTRDISNYQSKVKDIELALTQRTKERDMLTGRTNGLKKQLQTLKKQQEKVQREYEMMSVQNMNQNQKLNDMRSKLQTEKRQSQKMQAYYEQQLNYLSKTKEYNEHQIDELKWNIQKSKQQSEQTNARLKISTQQILKLNQDILIFEEKNKRTLEENKELQNIVEEIKKKIADGEEKQKMLLDQIKKKGQNIYDMQKKYQSSQSENFLLKQKLKQIQSNFEERRLNDQKNIKQKQKTLGIKGQQLNQVQLQVITLKQLAASLGQQTTMKSNEIAYLKQSLHTIKQDLTSRDIKIEETKEQLNQCNQKIQRITKQNDSSKKQLEQEKRQSTKMKKQWDDYRKDTIKALQKLIQQIGKDQQNNLGQRTLLTFPDATISAMQVQAIKKRSAILTKYQTKISQLNEQKILLQGQLRKTKNGANQKQRQLESQLKMQQDKYRQALSALQMDLQQLQKQTQLLQENKLQLTGEIQKKINQIKKREQFIEQLQEENRIIGQERQYLRGQLKQSEDKILQFKSNQIKWKANSESKITEISGQNQTFIDRLKVNIADLEKKVSVEQKNSKDKDQIIKKSQNRINQLIYDKQRAESRILQVIDKMSLIEQDKKENQKKIKNYQKQIKELAVQMLTYKESLSNQKIKLQQVQGKLSQAYAALTETQVDAEKLKAELDKKNSSKLQLQQSVKQKNDKIKTVSQKLTQQIKQLKEKIITLNSTLQLKDFQIGQQEVQIISMRQNINDLKDQVVKRKTDGLKVLEELQKYKNQDLYTSQNIDILQSEKAFLQDQNDRLKERIAVVEDELSMALIEVQNSDLKDKQFSKLKEQLQTLKNQKSKLSLDMKNSMSRLNIRSTNNLRGSRVDRGDDKKVRELQQLLQSKHIDLASERKRLMGEFEKERRQLISQIDHLKEQIQNLQSQYDFQRAQMNNQLDGLTEENEKLHLLLEQRNMQLSAREQQIYEFQNKIHENQSYEEVSPQKLKSDLESKQKDK